MYLSEFPIITGPIEQAGTTKSPEQKTTPNLHEQKDCLFVLQYIGYIRI